MNSSILLGILSCFFTCGIFANPVVGLQINPSSYFAQDGRIDIQLIGPVPNGLTYEWSSPTYPNFSSNDMDLTGLGVGVYDLTVTDYLCGVATLQFVLEADCPVINFSLTSGDITPPTSCSAADGRIRTRLASASGGIGPYTRTLKNAVGGVVPADAGGAD